MRWKQQHCKVIVVSYSWQNYNERGAHHWCNCDTHISHCASVIACVRELALEQRKQAKLESSAQQAAKQAQMELDALEAAARRGECSELQLAELQRRRCHTVCISRAA